MLKKASVMVLAIVFCLSCKGTDTGNILNLYVANEDANSIVMFDSVTREQSNLTPSRILAGQSTGFNTPVGIWLDSSSDQLYIANTNGHSILVFGNASTIDGNVTPSRTIAGAATTLNSPRGLWLDAAANRLYVANYLSNSILVFDNAGAVQGDVAPSRTIAGAATTLNGPRGLWLNPGSDQLYAANRDGNSILVFNAAGTMNGNVAPARTITGSSTKLNLPRTLWFDATSNQLYVANSGGTVVVFDNASTVSGDAAPVRTIAGAATTLNTPLGLWLDAENDELIVGDYAGNAILVFGEASKADGDIPPSYTIAGSATTFNLLGDIWLKGKGR